MDSNQTILVVEDSDEQFMAVLRAFHKSQIVNPVARCTDGDEALEFLFRTGRFAGEAETPMPAVILLDLNLPGTDGRDVLERIKADDELRKIPVVILTTSENPSDIQLCYREGASSYIIKPIRFDDFLKKVRTLKEYWFETVALPTASG
ncbi:response regulator [Paludisphaera mucosa]|uniref:Response regulator n=1 Tax=Paludisphaera mucosa TaxID=3030827 RepID=A0ABT6FHP2_9BACT|nr:response regulator [Paludisphaera mucosa]MDG3007034.1 response regulator [Paludisphaera mucosa]